MFVVIAIAISIAIVVAIDIASAIASAVAIAAAAAAVAAGVAVGMSGLVCSDGSTGSGDFSGYSERFRQLRHMVEVVRIKTH